jgi:uncharacterized membrane protein
MTAGPGLRGLHTLLGVQSLVVVLVSLNRLGSWSQGTIGGTEFLRWVDLNNLVLALVSLVAFHLLREHLRVREHLRAPSGRTAVNADRALGVTFIVGAYLLAAGYGAHEVTNYLHVRFCDPPADRLCEIIAYHDDGLSHLMFFAGFTLINLAIMLTPVAHPSPAEPTRTDTALIVVNALFIGAGIFANLAFEEIGFDLYVVAAIAVLAVVLVRRQPRQPILRYYAVAYVVGLLATAVVKLT